MAQVAVAEMAANQTLLRSRGSYLVNANPDAAVDTDVCALGIIVIHFNAVGVGGTSIPGPLTDIGADWLWHQMVQLDSIAATSANVANLGTLARGDIDSKAMRRVPSDHIVALIAQLASGDFAEVSVLAGIRFLFGQ